MPIVDTDIKNKIIAHDRAVPRYTSYPAAPVFQAGFPAETVTNWVDVLPQNSNLSLYVHIPFCPKLCHYCGCFTHITSRYAPVEDYVHLVRREIASMGRRMQNKHIVTHLHFGGGSPTMLVEQDFRLLMDTFREFFTFSDQAEIAVEVDPRHMTESLAMTYAQVGVNRISLGVQDFDDKVMQAVNRVQDFDVVYSAVNHLRAAGICEFNLDFIYGLPYQTVRSLTRSMDYALLLKPDRLALYGYAHVPWKKKNMRLIPDEALPDNGARYDLFMTGSQVLEESGYRPIGIDHFVRDHDDMAQAQDSGTLGRNFQGYTNIAPDALIGFGVSAISQYPQGYAQNTTASHDYQEAVLHGDAPPIAKGYAFKGEDIARKAIIEGLMCNLQVNVKSIWEQYTLDPERLQECTSLLSSYIAEGLVSLDQDGLLVIPKAARQIVRIIASCFDEYLPPIETAKRHSMAI
ncbi:MAG: oxygen-independent coproporphyrinogen III oxidase [Alphaproteobacteria bacterium]|jgi:oxygen-independent coproporphyrinogen-3 oxidase|nr:oxygen-independent coproporphyrinogen III oxidase [Alphaproteobacteria bacterium]MCB1550854.1 oxygen-independent coproporphyrinogen III oxidase [Alphaproteobacteria bacterium]MCB9984096.1 oxygen-independent coproporphyrinogen III oxidase [Micavibrio sp.]